MRTIAAVFGLALAVPVALATPALAKPADPTSPPVTAVLRQHEGFRAEVTYHCTGPKHQEGTITVALQQPLDASGSGVTTIATAREEADCDGQQREEKIEIPVTAGAVRDDRTVSLYTTLVVNGRLVADHRTPARPVVAPSASPSPTATASGTPSTSASPTATASATASATPSSEPTESESPETGTPSPTATASTTASATPSSSPTESEGPETETPTPRATGTASPSPSATS